MKYTHQELVKCPPRTHFCKGAQTGDPAMAKMQYFKDVLSSVQLKAITMRDAFLLAQAPQLMSVQPGSNLQFSINVSF